MNRVAIIEGCRTPFVKAGGAFSRFSFLDLGVHVVQSLVRRLDLKPGSIDELIFSTVLLDPRVPNFAREIVLRSGLPHSISAHSVSNNCISGLVATSMLADAIRVGRIKAGLAGGSESMSRPTLTLKSGAEKFFLKLARARSLGDKLKILSSFRPSFIIPVPPSPREPSTGLTMGEHCEMMAKEFGIGREEQDVFAFQSHLKASKAQEKGVFAVEIEAFHGIDKDNLIRGDTNQGKLGRLPPVFDRSALGTLTAGNSSALTDGASVICLMSEEEAKKQGREILGFLEGVVFSAISPSDGLLMAPVLAVPELFKRHALTTEIVDLFEIHEAFSAQVLANLKVLEFGWNRYPNLKPIGKIPQEKINVNGGSIAIGHPFAATGGRLILGALHELKRRKAKTAVLSVCAAGAMACAVLLRRN